MLTLGKRDKGPASPDSEHLPQIAVGEEDGVLGCAFSGIWTTRTVAMVDSDMREIENKSGFKTLALDLSKIEKLDTAGAWLIDRLISANEKKGVEVQLQGHNEIASILLQAVGDAARRDGEVPPLQQPNIVLRMLEAIGRRVYDMKDDFLASMNILGAKIGRAHV